MLTAIIDYGSGNLHSAEKAFLRMAAEHDAGKVCVTDDAGIIARADRIVLPGDGAFPHCRKALAEQTGIIHALTEAVIEKGRPFLGICVGMQLLASWGREYANTRGLNWIDGEVVLIEPGDTALKVPHTGWNNLEMERPHPVIGGIESGSHAYFVHSYHFRVIDPAHRVARVDHGADITAIIARDNMVGMQFHPEKSQSTGLRMIGNFLNWSP